MGATAAMVVKNTTADPSNVRLNSPVRRVYTPLSRRSWAINQQHYPEAYE